MNYECKDNEGFEDQLTIGQTYKGVQRGGSVQVENDNGVPCWYGLSKFGPGSAEPSEYD
jgi:hypothetical protein